VSDLIIRPTSKFIVARFLVTGIVFLAIESWFFAYGKDKGVPNFFPLIVPIIFVSPALRLARRQFTTVTLSGDRLRYETGAVGKITRTIQISRLQDVRVDQRPMQRMFGVGDISIETAGETSRLTIPDVDSPHAVADDILNRAHGGQLTS
jgi:putative membrane protein